jgi:predicted acyltransferase
MIMWPVGDVSIKAWLFEHIFRSWFGALNGSLMFALSFLVLSYVCMHWLYRKQLFWKV